MSHKLDGSSKVKVSTTGQRGYHVLMATGQRAYHQKGPLQPNICEAATYGPPTLGNQRKTIIIVYAMALIHKEVAIISIASRRSKV